MYENADDLDDAMGGGGDEERIECVTCGRRFIAEALQKHQKVCKKVFVQKRKVFDIKKVRQEAIIADVKEAGGLDDYEYKLKAKRAPKKQATEKPINGSKVSKWKAQSEMFR